MGGRGGLPGGNRGMSPISQSENIFAAHIFYHMISSRLAFTCSGFGGFIEREREDSNKRSELKVQWTSHSAP